MQIEARPREDRRQERHARLAAVVKGCARPVGMALCSFLFSLVRWLSIPSPFATAYLLAQGARGYQAVFPLLGLIASFALRLLWSAPLEPWLYAGALFAWLTTQVKPPRTQNGYLILAGLSMLPQLLATVLTDTPQAILLAFAAVPLCMGLTLWLRHGLDTLENGCRVMDTKDKACCLLPPLLLIAGLGYLKLFTVNLGYVASVYAVLACGYVLGSQYGGLIGLLISLALTLSGHDCRLMLPLTLGGIVCGLPKNKRWLSCVTYLGAALLALYIVPSGTPILPYLETLLAVGFFLLTPATVLERLRTLSDAAMPVTRGADNAFVQARLEQWEAAMRSMSAALPTISEDELAFSGAHELSALLCGGCSERKLCYERDRDKTERFFQAIWDAAQSGDDALDKHIATLRGCGCIRLHALPATVQQGMQAKRARMAMKAKARFQREMTVTHLDAMVAAITDIRRLTCGETLSDMQAAYQIGKAVHELNYPAELRYARRVDGHLQAELKQDGLIAKTPERLLRLLEKDAGLRLQARRVGRTRLELEELPLYSVELGVATVCAGKPGENAVSGDAVTVRQMRGGRYLLALSDGMGHGEKANTESSRTIELLMLALEAGYTHRQAITSVNGMMLTAADEERFATVDLFDLDLWTGDVRNEKLGACASYLVRGNYIKRVEGSSLPLGIMETVAPTSQGFRLHSGDILVVVSDGVSDALPEPQAMERAIADSLYIHPQRMADALLRNALIASGGTPRDDMTVVALLMVDRKRSTATDDTIG